MADLDTLRMLAGKATPGQWAFDGNCGGYITESGDKIARAYSASDAVYIAACDPQTILALLDENERLRAALEGAERKMVGLYRSINPHGNDDNGGNRFADKDEDVIASRAVLAHP